jgi:hypothetical protein
MTVGGFASHRRQIQVLRTRGTTGLLPSERIGDVRGPSLPLAYPGEYLHV